MTAQLNQVLNAYRMRSGDHRAISEFPVALLSELLDSAERITDAASPESDIEYARR